MADMDVRYCPACGAVFVEDSQMWTDPQCCPHCGYDLATHDKDRDAVETID